MKKVKDNWMEFYKNVLLTKKSGFASTSKKPSKYRIHKVFLVSALVTSAFFLDNCAGRSDPIKSYTVSCEVEVSKHDATPQDLNLAIRDQAGKINANQYTIINVKEDNSKKNKLYNDNSIYNIHDISCADLRECARIQTNGRDNNSKAEHYMTLELNKDIEALYIAYDERFQTDWLLNQKDYKLQIESNTVVSEFGTVSEMKAPCHIETTIPDHSASNKDAKVRFKIYKRLNFSKKGDKLIFPGNAYQMKPLIKDQTKVSIPTMYTIFIKPKVDVDHTSIPKVVEEIQSAVCIHRKEGYSPDIDLAKNAAIDDCEKNHSKKAGYICTIKGKCDTVNQSEDCVVEIQGHSSFPITSFRRHSEIDLNQSKSIVKIKVDGNNHTSNVRGHIHFEYLLDENKSMRTMQINSLHFKADPFGDYTDIKFALSDQTKAYCRDKLPPWTAPCQSYRIPRGTFISSVSLSVKGKPLAFDMASTEPIDINITNIGSKRSFQIKGGPLRTTLHIGHNIPVEVSIDLTGTFTNFAPFAEVSNEFETFSECTGGDCPEGSNRDPITLYAGGSFDIDDGTISSGNFAWYENYGLSTEKLWGNGKRFIIPPCQMSFGVHYMTLEVRDSADIPSTAEFKVRVIDTNPPVFTSVPGDHFYLATKPGKVRINLGNAAAYDNCQNKVMIENDAPEGFEAGNATPVTWTADDGFGNQTKAVQNVYVFLVEDGKLNQITKLLDKVITESQTNLGDCAKKSKCYHTLENVQGLLDELVTQLSGKIETSTRSEKMKEMSITETLLKARKSVHEALTTLDGANKQSIGWKRKAYEQLDDARKYLKEVVDTE